MSSPDFNVTKSSPDIHVKMSSPGVDVTMSLPRVDVTKSSPGVDVTKSSLGVDVTMSSPNLDMMTTLKHKEDAAIPSKTTCCRILRPFIWRQSQVFCCHSGFISSQMSYLIIKHWHWQFSKLTQVPIMPSAFNKGWVLNCFLLADWLNMWIRLS